MDYAIIIQFFDDKREHFCSLGFNFHVNRETVQRKLFETLSENSDGLLYKERYQEVVTSLQRELMGAGAFASSRDTCFEKYIINPCTVRAIYRGVPIMETCSWSQALINLLKEKIITTTSIDMSLVNPLHSSKDEEALVGSGVEYALNKANKAIEAALKELGYKK